MSFTLNCRGKLLLADRPLVMGILNLTPDSFSDGGKFNNPEAALGQVEKMLREGADIIDIGGYSSRPGADDITVDEELSRIHSITSQIIDRFPEAVLSIDTFRSEVAREMLELGAHIINDISGGILDSRMFETVASFVDAPYILMHMPGTPQTMQQHAQYEKVVDEVLQFLIERINLARQIGIRDLVIDPGFGFGKTLLNNYELLMGLERFVALDLPVLVGISRKSMLYRVVNAHPKEVEELAAALHLRALAQGAAILRVHEVRPARNIVDLHLYLRRNGLV